MASGIWLFAANPAEWEKLKADPNLAMLAANERHQSRMMCPK